MVEVDVVVVILINAISVYRENEQIFLLLDLVGYDDWSSVRLVEQREKANEEKKKERHIRPYSSSFG